MLHSVSDVGNVSGNVRLLHCFASYSIPCFYSTGQQNLVNEQLAVRIITGAYPAKRRNDESRLKRMNISVKVWKFETYTRFS